MSKTIRLEITFTDKEWERLRKHYSEEDIRSTISGGGLEELEALVYDSETNHGTREPSSREGGNNG